MIIVDANILIYAVNRDAPLHFKAKLWLEKAINGQNTVAFSWNVILAFLRLVTRQGLFLHPLPLATAFELLSSWLDQPSTTIVHPGPRHFRILEELLLQTGTGGNLTSDAHLATLAIENGAELCSSDSDFARFQGLNWSNPLS